MYKPGKHLAELDGLRGAAILLVLVYHLTRMIPVVALDKAIKLITGSAWIGVDLFFVLSGFLITGILFDTKTESAYFRNFFMRRILRIFPLYYGFLLVLFFIVPLWLQNDEIWLLQSNQSWYWTYTTNFMIWLKGFDAAPYTSHFWSLAIEEQFYLLFPFLVYFCNPKQLMTVCALLIPAAFLARLGFRWSEEPLANYVLTFTRADALATGASVALLIRYEWGIRLLRRLVKPLLIATGILLMAIFLDEHGLKPGSFLMQTIGYSSVALFFGGILTWIILTQPASLLAHFWRLPILTFFGHYSYALYLFHVPVLKWVEQFNLIDGLPRLAGSKLLGQFAFAAVCMIISITLSYLSWHLYEKHFLTLKKRFVYTQQYL